MDRLTGGLHKLTTELPFRVVASDITLRRSSPYVPRPGHFIAVSADMHLCELDLGLSHSTEEASSRSSPTTD